MGTKKVTLTLEPAGTCCEVAVGTPLRDVLFQFGVEMPCGGKGRCGGCKVRMLAGDLPAESGTAYRLPADAIKNGWRLACKHEVSGPLTLEIAQWDSLILADHSTFSFVPQDGRGIAVDIGTTTMAAQLLDLQSGHVLKVRTARNPQGQFGADLMSRISFALEDGQQVQLRHLLRDAVGALVGALVDADQAARLRQITVVGNSPMHHFFSGLDVQPFAALPFDSPHHDACTLNAAALGWDLPQELPITVLPNIGGFVGSDVLAGIVASNMAHQEKLTVLIDLGTNGEMVVGNQDGMICASTAAGPAFEAAKISCGMQASTGAISEVKVVDGKVQCTVIGGGKPRGICGSGLVDAIAAGLELGAITASGRFQTGVQELQLADGIALNQADIRELQLAKGAVAAGVRILLKHLGRREDEVEQVLIAGAFGNYVRLASASRIGLLRFPQEITESIGNSALLGAKMALFMDDVQHQEVGALARSIRHLCLSSDPDFMDIYADEMFF